MINGRTDRQGYIDPESDADQEYICILYDFIGSATPFSACYILPFFEQTLYTPTGYKKELK